MPLVPEQQSRAVKQLLDNVDELAVLPHVVFKVLELTGVESAAAEMERAIIVDPGFSAKLLSHANSSYYGLSRKVTSIRDAIVYLGLRVVREIAMTVGVFDMFVGKNDKDSLRRRAWWRHSIDTAVCCKLIAAETYKLSTDDAYTCGLLHMIGKTLLDRFGDADYERVELLISHGAPEDSAERAVFLCDHIEVAVAAAQKWGLPPIVIGGLQYSQASTGEHSEYGACVAVASAIARAAVQGPQDGERLPLWALGVLGFTPEQAADLYEKGITAIANNGKQQLAA